MNNIGDLKFNRLIIVAYRLPYKFIKKNDIIKAVQNSGGLVSAVLSLSQNIYNIHPEKEVQKIIWAGKGDAYLEKNKISSQYDFDLFPLYIPDNINDKFYGGFCNDMIWPLFHYFPDYTVFDNSYFKAYIKATQLVSEQLRKIIRPGDFVWIHDYHFLLLPEMVRSWAPWANIGFFLHIPFPSFEIFRLMPRSWREVLIKGMLGADLIGFHTNDYTHHFIKSAKHALGLECNNNVIKTEKRTVKADAFPIGIDFEKFHTSSTSAPIVKEKEKLGKSLQNLKLIFSVDRLDYSKGLLNRLLAFEYFLQKYPLWRGIVVFNMVVVPSRENIERYKLMKKEIEATVGRINGEYSTLDWRPIIYQYKSLHYPELVALYEVSEVALITPLRDGMNLVAKEYIACQHEKNGVLILSETAGASAELKEAIIINPHDKQEIASAINMALTMKEKEKKMKITRMQQRIKNYDVFTWANDFFNQLMNVKNEQACTSAKLIDDAIKIQWIHNYRSSSKRILLLDYDGTLIPFSNYPETAFISKKIYNLLSEFSADEKNTIVVISGREKNFIEKQLKNLKVNLIAEHGYFYKQYGKEWNAPLSIDLEWKKPVRNILTEYVSRCNGSMIEEKHSSIAWHYRNADIDFANLRLFELKKDLNTVLNDIPDVTILEGSKVLEIKSVKYNKGTMTELFLQNDKYDFILAIGDDKTDEFIFDVLPGNAISVKIGTEPTFAKYYLSDQNQIVTFLSSLISTK